MPIPLRWTFVREQLTLAQGVSKTFYEPGVMWLQLAEHSEDAVTMEGQADGAGLRD